MELGQIGIQKKDATAIRFAVQAFEDLEERKPHLFPAFFKDLGILYSYLLPQDATVRPKLVAAWRKFLKETSPNDPGHRGIENELQKYLP